MVNGKKMSKSVGNVVYPSDIVEKGFNGAELRFFLIYGAYREELNFTFEGLAEARQRLERMRCMIEDLQETKPTSHSEVKTATSKLASDFEAHMNNNLDIKGAFDSLHQKVEKISLHKPLSAKELENVMSDLRRVDTVLQCIF